MKEDESEEENLAEIPHTFRNLGRSLTLLGDLRKVAEIMTAAVRPGIEERGNERVGTGRISTGALRTPRGN
jgi:hypothetical protein